MSAKTLLIEARGIVRNGWCKDAYATGLLGGSVKPLSYRARHYCIVGALVKASGKTGQAFMDDGTCTAAMRALRRAEPHTPTIPVLDWNDAKGTTKADVVRLFDDAIAAF